MQALYYGLRTYLLGLRDTASKAVQLVRAQHAEQTQQPVAASNNGTAEVPPSSPNGSLRPPSNPSDPAAAATPPPDANMQAQGATSGRTTGSHSGPSTANGNASTAQIPGSPGSGEQTPLANWVAHWKV